MDSCLRASSRSSIQNRDNPNLASNRMLFQEEIRSLQRERAYQRQKLSEIDKKLEDTRENYRKHQEGKHRELESIPSLLHMYKDSIKSLEDLRAVHEAEMDRLSGLLSPARRCPEDILRIIFELLGIHECSPRWVGDRAALAEAARMSHVCRHWRAAAVTTTCLWSSLHATMKDKPSMIRFMFNTMCQRLKSRPANIRLTFDALDTTDDFRLLCNTVQACSVEQFQAIDLLHLEVGCSMDILQVSKQFNVVQVKHLYVSTPLWKKKSNISHLDYGCLLRKFTTPQLTLRSMDAISLGSTPIYQLRSLKVSFGTTAIPHLGLNSLVNLEDLSIFDHQGIWDEDITLPMLRKLKIAEVDGSFWYRLITPQVLSVQLSGALSEGVLGYLDRNPSVRHLEIEYAEYWDDASARRLAGALPALESLTVSGPREAIAIIIGFLANSQQINSEDMAFPDLLELSVEDNPILGGGASFPWNALERLINDRCFANNRDTRSALLEFHLRLYCTEMESTPWNDSPVLKSGKVSETFQEWGNEVDIRFTWPI